jgi:subtilisin family serine protease
MNTLFRLALLATLPAAACAPAGAAAPPTGPVPGGTAMASPTLKRLAEAPEQWWLLDPVRDSVAGVGATRAYTELLAGRPPQREVVVAIIDSGVDAEHEDLRENIWRNPGEARDGRDTDGNGYADDLIGWNFIGGADGRNVEHDTYEVTRIYAALRPRFEGARADTLSAAARQEHELYQQVRRELNENRQRAQQMLAQMRSIGAALAQAETTLRQHLGTQTLTVQQVRDVRNAPAAVMQARQLYLQLAELGATEKELQRATEHFTGQLQYGYNPDFDPRPIVGDDYANPRERHYGNSDVRGPDATHGTHVAGIVGAVRGNARGIDGIAPAVRLMPVRAVPDGDERDKDVANAIRYAVDNGAHIVNMSFGKAYSPNKDVVDAAVRYAEERGVLLVHAAGNDSENLESKGNFPNRDYLGGGSARNWIEVGASSWRAAGDSLAAGFSNYGRTRVDVFAPGVDIYSTVPDNGYERNSGTSMAAPVVSGVAALLMAHFPELSAVQVRQILLETATPFADRRVARPGENAGFARFGELSATGGVVNAHEAVRRALEITRAN